MGAGDGVIVALGVAVGPAGVSEALGVAVGLLCVGASPKLSKDNVPNLNGDWAPPLKFQFCPETLNTTAISSICLNGIGVGVTPAGPVGAGTCEN